MSENNTDSYTNGTERDTKPGVCEHCGYRIQPDDEDFTSVGGWDFAHERCVDADIERSGGGE